MRQPQRFPIFSLLTSPDKPEFQCNLRVILCEIMINLLKNDFN